MAWFTEMIVKSVFTRRQRPKLTTFYKRSVVLCSILPATVQLPLFEIEVNTMRMRIIPGSAFLIALLTWSCATPITHAQQASPGSTAEQAFFEAIRKGDATKVSELLKENPALIKANFRGTITPVLLAVYAKHPEIAESLIATGIEPNIFEAAATGRVDRVRALLKQNPELIHAWSPDGWTALHLNFNHLDVARLLIDAGADLNLNSRNKLNATPLQGAAANNWLELARLYLAHGANVNSRNEGGTSPLHEAAGNGFLEFARLLIENGANVDQKDDDGKTPLTIAIENKHPEIAKLLKDHGASQ
jgi:ankyrin repeat protein